MFFMNFDKKKCLEVLSWTLLLILLISGLVIIITYHKEFYGYGYLSWFVICPLSNKESLLLFGHFKKWTKSVNKLINVLILAANGIILLALLLLSVFSVVGNN